MFPSLILLYLIRPFNNEHCSPLHKFFQLIFTFNSFIPCLIHYQEQGLPHGKRENEGIIPCHVSLAVSLINAVLTLSHCKGLSQWLYLPQYQFSFIKKPLSMLQQI